MLKEFYYSIPEHDGETRFEIRVAGSYDLKDDAETLAEICAQNYHYHHDGWDTKWPLVVCIYETKESPELGRFSVEREEVPRFSATPVKKKRADGEPCNVRRGGGWNAENVLRDTL